MEKKTGSAGTLVAPAAPTDALEADNADPGEVENIKAAQRESKTGKYGTTPTQAFKPPQTPEEWAGVENTWIEVELVGEDDKPITGELVQITVPDGRVYRSSTDHLGLVRVQGFKAGSCRITFPNLDQEAWEEL